MKLFYNLNMEIKTYKKDAFYSYILGAFPTIEALKNRQQDVLKIIIHSSFKNQEVINMINTLRKDVEMVINDKLLDKLSNKENCYVAAVFKKYKMTLNKEENHLVLVNPMNMGNFGTIIRSALGFNFTNIVVIRPAIDMFDPKVLRAAMGSFFSCNIVYYDTYEQYKKDYPNRKAYSFMLQANKTLQETTFNTKEKISLIFGNESSGLPLTYLNNDSIIIKHSNNIDSLNLPTAVGIALYEVNKQINKK